MFRILKLFLVVALIAQNTNAQQVTGLKDFLKAFYDVSSLPAYEPQSYSAQESSYDRTGQNNDGFGGNYSFVKRNADSSLVLFDIQGTGLINRIWTPTPTDDSLDFYIDDTTKPSFTICYRDLFSGKVYPFIAPLCANQLGGFYCYLPIPFEKSCKIVFRGKKTRFHQIGYRLYPGGKKIRKFSLPLDKEEINALEKIKNSWSKANVTIQDIYDNGLAISQVKKNFVLKPGQTITFFETATPGRIAGLEIVSSAALEGVAKNIDLRITWDNAPSPAVHCPLADYFGYAFGKASMQGLLAGSDGKRHYAFFPMPYDHSARIELIYRRSVTDNETNSISFFSTVYTVNKKRDPQREGKFYAYWKRDDPVPALQPFTMLDIKGKGHFAGVVLQSQGLGTGITSFFEGDDSTVVDGELRMHGTGSEDFFNGGWYALLDCWDDAMSLPLSGALDYSIPLCRTGGYRYFLTDKISFEKSFFQSIEHGPENNLVPSDYTSVSYYYCSEPNPQKIQPVAANTKIYKPDTLEIYPQLMFTAMDEYIAVTAKWAYPIPAKTLFYTIRDNSMVKMVLNDVPPGDYSMYLDYVKSPDAASFSIWQRQTQLSDWIDAVAGATTRIAMQPVTDIRVTTLNNTFSFHFRTGDGHDKFTLNRIILVRK